MAQEHNGMLFVPQELREKAALYEERNVIYGDNYKRFGPIMALLFPNGLTLNTPDDFNRYGVFVQVAAKLTRYAENFTRGGHIDSLDDTAVYSMMLKELDVEAKSAPKHSVAMLAPDVANWLSGLSEDKLREYMNTDQKESFKVRAKLKGVDITSEGQAPTGFTRITEGLVHPDEGSGQ